MAIDPFRYDWQAPFQGAARRPPAAKRLTLEDLLAMQEQFQPAPRPAALRSVGELDQQDRRGIRQDSIIAALSSLGASIQTNDWRHAGAGAGQIADIQRGGIAAANARQERDWQLEQQQRAQEIEQEQRQGQQAALFGVYEKIAAAEPPGSGLTAKAEAAARAGSMSELQGLLAEVPKRNAARSKGYDPDAWDTNERLQQELAAELERQKAAQAEAAELARLEKEEEIRREAKIAEEQALREAGLGSYAPPQLPPLSRIEAEEAIRAKFRAQGGSGAATRRIVEAPDGTWGVAEIDAAGELVFKPGKGQAPKVEKQEMRVFTDEEGVTKPYILDKTDGSWYPMKVSQRPRPEAPAGPPPAAANAAPQANHWRNLAADALTKGGTEEEALRRLRAIGPQNGFTPEQILENAKALARKRGWKG